MVYQVPILEYDQDPVINDFTFKHTLLRKIREINLKFDFIYWHGHTVLAIIVKSPEIMDLEMFENAIIINFLIYFIL